MLLEELFREVIDDLNVFRGVRDLDQVNITPIVPPYWKRWKNTSKKKGTERQTQAQTEPAPQPNPVGANIPSPAEDWETDAVPGTAGAPAGARQGDRLRADGVADNWGGKDVVGLPDISREPKWVYKDGDYKTPSSIADPSAVAAAALERDIKNNQTVQQANQAIKDAEADAAKAVADATAQKTDIEQKKAEAEKKREEAEKAKEEAARLKAEKAKEAEAAALKQDIEQNQAEQAMKIAIQQAEAEAAAKAEKATDDAKQKQELANKERDSLLQKWKDQLDKVKSGFPADAFNYIKKDGVLIPVLKNEYKTNPLLQPANNTAMRNAVDAHMADLSPTDIKKLQGKDVGWWEENWGDVANIAFSALAGAATVAVSGATGAGAAALPAATVVARRIGGSFTRETWQLLARKFPEWKKSIDRILDGLETSMGDRPTPAGA